MKLKHSETSPGKEKKGGLWGCRGAAHGKPREQGLACWLGARMRTRSGPLTATVECSMSVLAYRDGPELPFPAGSMGKGEALRPSPRLLFPYDWRRGGSFRDVARSFHLLPFHRAVLPVVASMWSIRTKLTHSLLYCGSLWT